MPRLLRLAVYGRCPAPCRLAQPCPDHPETFGIRARFRRGVKQWRTPIGDEA